MKDEATPPGPLSLSSRAAEVPPAGRRTVEGSPAETRGWVGGAPDCVISSEVDAHLAPPPFPRSNRGSLDRPAPAGRAPAARDDSKSERRLRGMNDER